MKAVIMSPIAPASENMDDKKRALSVKNQFTV